MSKVEKLIAKLNNLRARHSGAIRSINSIYDIDNFYSESEKAEIKMRNDIIFIEVRKLQLKIDVVELNIDLEKTRAEGQSVLAHFC